MIQHKVTTDNQQLAQTSSEEEELSGLVIKKRKGKEIPQGVIELSTSSMSKLHFFDFF